MKKNDILTLNVESVTNLGAGVARHEGLVVFVVGAVGGDTVRAKIIKVNSGYAVARLEALIKESPDREPTELCRAPSSCGGCAYRALKYEAELKIKRQNVASEFAKNGLGDVSVLPVLSVKDKNGEYVTSGYRNKAQYRFVKTKTGIRAGFYAQGTHRVVSYEECPLHPERFAAVANAVCKLADELGYSVYDEESGQGLLRHLYIREGKESGELGLCMVINGEELLRAERFCSRIREEFPEIVSITVNINRKNTNVILGDRYKTVYGKPDIEDIFCGKRLKISPAAFYQVNHDAAELLCEEGRRRLELSGGEYLLDLYCGIGTIGLSMSDACRRLVGVEIVPEAVACAGENARASGVENAEFFCADSADGGVKLLQSGGETPDAVVLDPPRKGCDAALLLALAEVGIEKVLYISCNPATLARDVAIMRKLGYGITEVQPVDLFPRTGHVETVVCLSREKVDDYIKISVNTADLKKNVAGYATYPEIKAWVLDNYGFKVHSKYIAQIKDKCGIKERENYYIGEGKSRDMICPPDKEKAIIEAFKHFGMI